MPPINDYLVRLEVSRERCAISCHISVHLRERKLGGRSRARESSAPQLPQVASQRIGQRDQTSAGVQPDEGRRLHSGVRTDSVIPVGTQARWPAPFQVALVSIYLRAPLPHRKAQSCSTTHGKAGHPAPFHYFPTRSRICRFSQRPPHPSPASASAPTPVGPFGPQRASSPRFF